MRKLLLVFILLIIVGCTMQQNRVIDIVPIPEPQENNTQEPALENSTEVPVENKTVPPKPVDEAAAKNVATTICLDETEFNIESVCMDDAGLRLKLENKGSDIDHFEVKVRDLFDNEFYSVGTLPGLKEDQTSRMIILEEKLTAIPYRVQVKPVIVVKGVEFPCTPATELFDAGDREEFRAC